MRDHVGCTQGGLQHWHASRMSVVKAAAPGRFAIKVADRGSPI